MCNSTPCVSIYDTKNCGCRPKLDTVAVKEAMRACDRSKKSSWHDAHLVVSANMGIQNGWFIVENPKMDDWGVPLF